MVLESVWIVKINLPLTQAKIIHSIADGVAPRFVGASVWYCSVGGSFAQNQKPTTDSIRCEANISKTSLYQWSRTGVNGIVINKGIRKQMENRKRILKAKFS